MIIQPLNYRSFAQHSPTPKKKYALKKYIVFPALTLLVLGIGGIFFLRVRVLAAVSFCVGMVLTFIASSIENDQTVEVATLNEQALETFARDNLIKIQSDDYRSIGRIFDKRHHSYVISPVLAYSRENLPLKMYIVSLSASDVDALSDYGVIEFTLPKKLPHIYIDAAKDNRVYSEYLLGFRKEQMIRLEGDFSNAYTVWCPEAFRAEALTILNPQAMETLMGTTQNFDIELLEDRAFVYYKKIATLSQETIQKLDEAAYAVAELLAPQLDTFQHDIHKNSDSKIKDSKLKRILN